MKFKKYLKEDLKFIFALFYFVYLKLSNNKTRQVVIYYHGITKEEVPGFKRQMACIAKEYSVVKLSEIMEINTNGSKAIIAITFDDAFVNIMENAVPILKKYGLIAAMFIPTDNLGQLPRWKMHKSCLDKNELVMSKEQIRQLNRDGFETFSHTMSHPVLTEIEDNRLRIELIESKHALERIIGHEVIGISYPYGACDSRVFNAVQEAGYELGFTSEPCMVDGDTNNMNIGRVSVSPRDGLLKFKLKAYGAYQVLCILRVIRNSVQKIFTTKNLSR